MTSVINRYGCRELGYIASECDSHHGLHIAADHVVVEIVDENGQSCKPGKLGEIVVTDLDNLAFPLIRYKIGDISIISDRTCECGRGLPLLEKVEGRTFDLIVGINGNKVTGSFWTLLRHNIKGIKKIQVIQKNEKSIKIKIVGNNDFTSDEAAMIERITKEKLGEGMIVSVETVKDISLTKSGKFRWVISEVSLFNNG